MRQPLAEKLLRASRSTAKTRKYEHDLTLEFIEGLLVPMTCSATGLKLEWTGPTRPENPMAPSLDRIDSTKGYLRSNVRVVCWIFNQMKSKYTDEEFARIARAFVKHRGD